MAWREPDKPHLLLEGLHLAVEHVVGDNSARNECRQSLLQRARVGAFAKAMHLNRAQKEQTKGSEQVLRAIETIKTVSETQSRSVKHLEEAIEVFKSQADVLRGEVRRFRV